jgi:hypothetical protein
MPNCETYENATNKEDFENKLALTFSKLTIAEEDYAIEASKKAVVETEAAAIAYEPIITYTSYDEIVIHGGEQFNSVPTSVCMVEKEKE